MMVSQLRRIVASLKAGSVARVPWRRVLTGAGLVASLGLIVAGIGLIYAPAGLIAGGLGLFALLTFDLAKAGRLTWPR